MRGYRLSAKALDDVAEIISYLHSKRAPSLAVNFEKRLPRGFDDLGRLPALGHRRTQLTSRNLLFYNVLPYVVIFRRRTGSIEVVRVLHGARDISRLI